MWVGGGNAYVIHKFGKVRDGAEAQGVVGTESHVGSSDGFPVQWNVSVTKSLTSRDDEICTYDEGLGSDDVWVILGLLEGTSGIVFGHVDFLVRKG